MVAIILIYILDEERNHAPLIGFALIGLVVMGAIFGSEISKSSKKKITPKIKVECENNKCDTTYIYE